MPRRTWVEIGCDECGCADHYVPGCVDAQARANGWIVARGGRYFCSKKCYDRHRARNAGAEPGGADRRR